ncbi:VOC family protein [Streptomyces sp. NPDC058457]|uniref:VOC family protein n=1 Tax=Streptomyces sp. NPDC058457 TaxID=3346507 RepID=UPI003659AF4F
MNQPIKVRLHHLGVQTSDIENCLSWYLDFFHATQKWELDQFSELTLSRLPGIRRLIEVAAGDIRFHIFDRADHNGRIPDENSYQFQHACIAVSTPEEIAEIRRHWIDLYDSGRYTFARPDGPTDIVVDSDGVMSLYLYDVNGLEYEFSYVPEGDR